MDADLDSLLTVVFCTADDLLPTKPGNARRMVTDAEVVTLVVAQVLLGHHGSDRRFLAAAERRLKHLFPQLPTQDAFHKRRARLEASIEWLIGVFASQSPGYHDNLLLLDSTPVETARSRETVKRAGDSALADAIGDAAGYGYCPSHSRYFYGMRLHLLSAPDGTPRAATLWSPERGEREVAVGLLARAGLRGGETVIADKGYAGAEFQHTAAQLGATIVHPNRKAEPGQAPIISGIRQRIESIINTTKDILGLERHGARTLHNLRVRICVRLLALAACITHNHQLGLPSRHLSPYTV
jgi:Transposase DDE domain